MSFDIPYITPSYTTHYLRTPGNEILDMPIQIIIILTATHKTVNIQLPWSSKICKIKTIDSFFSLSRLSKKKL